MRLLRSLLLILLSVLSCKKSDNSANNSSPNVTKVSFTIDSASVQPAEFITIKANEQITKDTGTVQLAGKQVFLFKIDSFHYAFFVPVLGPGKYTLDLTKLNGANSPEFVIRDYDGITNADAVLTEETSSYNVLADSLEKNSPFNQNAAKDAELLRQLTLQFNENIKQCTPEQKLLLAYQCRNMKPTPFLFQKPNIDTTYVVERVTGNGSEDPSDVGIALSLNFTKKQLQAYKAAGAVPIALAAVVFAPPPFDVVAALTAIIAFRKYLSSIKDAQEAEGAAIRFAFNADEGMNEASANGTSSTPIETNSTPVWVRYLAKYRTIRQSDESGPNSTLADVIKAAYELEIKDKSIKSIYENIKSKFSRFFDKVNEEYIPFVSTVPVIAKQKVATVLNKFLTVSNVSNPDITMTAVDDDDKGLKLTVTNPSKNITAETNFTFQVTYTQAAINNQVTITEHAKFIPVSTPKVTTTVTSAITQTSAVSGGIITSDGGSQIVSKGICYGSEPNPVPDILNTVTAGTGSGSFVSNITGLQPGKIYHLRAFASNSVGIGYGNDVSFTTLQATRPVLNTTYANSVTATTAVSGGNITDDGGTSITARGVCWSTSHNPTIALPTKTTDGTGTGSFTSNIIGLDGSKTYYVLAYATNSAGTAYGNEISFTTAMNNDLNGTTWYGYYRCASWEADGGYNAPANFPIQVPKGYAPVTITFSTTTDTIVYASMAYVWNGGASTSQSGSINADHTQITWTWAELYGDAMPSIWQISSNQMTGVFTPRGGGCVTSFTFFKL